MLKWMELKRKVYLDDKGGNLLELVSSVGLITVKEFNLSVHFNRDEVSMLLILMANCKIGISVHIYDESLCNKHWSIAYCKENQCIFLSKEMCFNN